jgi:extracellular elastinolytic metalloproteinase
MRLFADRSRGLGLFALTLAALALLVPAATFGAGEIPEIHNAKSDFDARTGTVAPTAAQLSAVEALGAEARWNRFGTPSSLIDHDGLLATGLAAPSAETAARSWLASNSEIFGNTAGLALLNDAKLAESNGHAVTFRQEFGGVPATQDGLVTVGVVGTAASGWSVAYASSSLSGDSALAGQPQLSPREGWVAAARDAGLDVSLADITSSTTEHGWTVLEADGVEGEQRTRLSAFPTATAGVAPAWETYVLSGLGSDPQAYKTFVDARNGTVLFRESIVEHVHQEQPEAFTGEMPAADAGCGPDHGPYTAPPNTVSVEVVASANVPANDIVLHLKHNGVTVASFDSGTSPEAIHYQPAGGVPEGDYFTQVCDFGDGSPPLQPSSYTGTIAMNDIGDDPIPYPPKWRVFPANPLLGPLAADPWGNPSTDIRELWCWDASVNGAPVEGCDDEVKNSASRAPWDVDVRTGTPTFTTRGNNAITAEAWFSPLTPGPTGYRPFSADRNYDYPWTNAWFTSDCSQTTFTPGTGNDISAAVTNLFVMHNRMHDWAYYLGFDEENWNSQESNFGNTSPSRENDATIGDAQAGAVSGGWPSYLGRDNANMIPLPDGVRPITNMYLWQPLAGAFYSPCVDGDYDMAVIGHEYGHLIENRMIGKGGLRAGHHAGAMGESNGDLNGVEILNEYGFVPVSGENRFAVGAYATGNKRTAIRNYGMNFPSQGAFPTPGVTPEIDPLNFSNIGYDITHAQVHADGEIWSATNYDIRQALVTKYNAGFPESDVALQRDCADGINPPSQCPGNRRWAQLMYDAYLLMPVAPSMLDARDAYLAADRMRFGGANQLELWGAFAKRGFGEGAFSTNNSRDESDTDPKPDFASPLHNEATVTFRAVAPDEANAVITNARVFVGHYEARVSPVADTNPATNATGTGANNLDDVAAFVPGTYEFVVQARGYGHLRLRRTFAAGRAYTVTFSFPTNWASTAKGATATGDGARIPELLDDTEATNWESTGAPVEGRQVTVDLGGGAKVVRRVQVSAMLRTNPGFPDPVTQNRFTALRQFEIWTCNANDPGTANCSLPTGFSRIYTSPDNAFPGGTPRPLAPNLLLRDFNVPDTTATHVRIRVLTNQCTGNPAFQGDQEADPLSNSDCRLGTAPLLTPKDKDVRIAELQVYSRS